jgi:hypothetical protein
MVKFNTFRERVRTRVFLIISVTIFLVPIVYKIPRFVGKEFTQGNVIEYARKTVFDPNANGGSLSNIGYAVIKYQIEGELYETYGLDSRRYDVGDDVLITYLADSPSIGRPHSYKVLFRTTLLLSGIAWGLWAIFYFSLRLIVKMLRRISKR